MSKLRKNTEKEGRPEELQDLVAATPVGILYRRKGKKKVEMQENYDSYRNCTEELMYEYDR